METYFIHFMICLSFYIIGAYATTDILRLLKGSTVSVNAPDCYCPICHNKITLKNQLPIFSYIKNHGTCFHCKNQIPISDLFLEVFLFFSLTGISLLLNFRWNAFFLCFCFYETVKVGFLLFYGPREHDFLKNYIRSVCNNFITFFLIAILFLFANII